MTFATAEDPTSIETAIPHSSGEVGFWSEMFGGAPTQPPAREPRSEAAIEAHALPHDGPRSQDDASSVAW